MVNPIRLFFKKEKKDEEIEELNKLVNELEEEELETEEEVEEEVEDRKYYNIIVYKLDGRIFKIKCRNFGNTNGIFNFYDDAGDDFLKIPILTVDYIKEDVQISYFKKNEEYGFTIENPLEKPTPKIKRNRLKEVSN